MKARFLQQGATARLPGLEGLRGVAALGVVAWHQLGFTVSEPILGHAYKGVGLFFMLSGFVIAARYEAELKDGMSPWRFGLLRLLRLYPLYLTGTLLGFALALAGLGLSEIGPAEAWRSLPAALGFWPGGAPNDHHLFPLNAPAWSLYLELAACLAYAFLLPGLSTRALVLAAGAGFVLIEGQLLRWGNLDGGWNRESFLVGVARILYAFPMGVLLYRLWSRGRLPVVRLPVWAVCAMFLGVIAVPYSRCDCVMELCITGGLWPLLVVLGAQATAGRTQTRAAEALGAPSYALYALHFPVLLACHRLFPDINAPATAIAGVASLMLAWGLSVLATHFVDAPVRRRLGAMRYFEARPASPAPSAAVLPA